MKATFCAIVLVLLLGPATSTVMAQEKKKMPSQEEMMKRWQEAMTPGEQHKKLEAFVGAWDSEVKIWMAGPSGEPSVSRGAVEYTMALGGRFLRQEVSGDMMGQTMKGVGYTGYDNFRKKYVAFWIDNMGTGMSTMEGTMDKDGTTLTMLGKMDDPMTGEKDKKVKYVTRMIDKDTHVFESYDITAYGDKKPVMVITHTRKK